MEIWINKWLNYSAYIEFAKKALENSKNVIIEKPVTSNSSELKELIKIAEEKNLILIEAVNIHYLPAFKEIKKNISKVGNPKIVSLNYSQYSSRYDAFKNGTILPAFDYKKSGGALMDLNVYNINFIVSLFGRPESINYSANIEKRIDTSGILTMDYGNFKAVAIGAKDCKAPTISVIQGDGGSIALNKPANQITFYELTYNDNTGETFKDESPEHRLFYEFAEFIRIIDEKDMKKVKEMLDISVIVSEIMEEARKCAKVVFGCEE